MDHILSIVLFTPLVGLLVLLFIPSSNARAVKLWANIASFAGFLVCLPLIFRFDRTKDFQFVEKADWIPSLGASYHLGIDGFSLLLVVLTALLGFLAILSSWNAIQIRLKEYYAYFLLLQVGMLGVFMALDFLLFFVFWELVLVPMYFIIGIWGGPRRVYAAIKFIIYTLIGSVLMLLGILMLYFEHYSQFQVLTFNIADLLQTDLSGTVQWWVFWAFFLGFAVKVPMWPFHTWLPDAHVEAPTAGSVILASVLLKMGTYGFLRFSLPLLPDAAKNPTIVNIMAVLSIIAIVYGALVSLMQKDWKKLVAYSSVSHLGFCTLGIFALNPAGIAGSILQQINHGISTGMLFLIVGVVYERRHTREISEYGGLLRIMPVFAIVFLITALSSMGMPPLNGFIGEITILQGVFQMSFNWAFWCVVGILLGAAYLIWLYQRTMLGEVPEKNTGLKDLSPREIAVFAPLLVWAFWIGLYPRPFFEVLERPVAQIVERVRPGYYAERNLRNPLASPSPAARISAPVPAGD
ncbi:MAG: NADH-quinone oxidoreductase subunit M [Bryobacteraceae bacterium]|nr:NADH-quinone oxidoreductase subunit M [Bryobacterales bacterium]MEB2361672.1 NADH-quinone oxidoreductase subunit M [Bryobacterales bacterium]NUN00126.1 NADH-quinone oxidoreductase subunit M [Bryobacteraceae bacterium]